MEAYSRLPRLAEEREKARIHAAAIAAALRPAMQTGKGDRGVKAKTGCLIYGEEDHYKRNCPQIKKQKVVADEFVGTCHRCDKFGHKAAQCRSQLKRMVPTCRETGRAAPGCGA